MKEILCELAHKELIQKPQYISDCWFPIVSKLQHLIPNPNFLDEIYLQRQPTNAKLLALLKANPSCAAENDKLSHLKLYIKGLHEAKLSSFLQLTTGLEIFNTSALNVSMTNQVLSVDLFPTRVVLY